MYIMYINLFICTIVFVVSNSKVVAIKVNGGVCVVITNIYDPWCEGVVNNGLYFPVIASRL